MLKFWRTGHANKLCVHTGCMFLKAKLFCAKGRQNYEFCWTSYVRKVCLYIKLVADKSCDLSWRIKMPNVSKLLLSFKSKLNGYVGWCAPPSRHSFDSLYVKLLVLYCSTCHLCLCVYFFYFVSFLYILSLVKDSVYVQITLLKLI